MTKDKIWPFEGPRLAGMREHYNRILFFFEEAQKFSDSVKKFRFMIASIYSAQAIVELICESADKKQLSVTRQDLDSTLPKKLPWYNLIEKIRIHDFHRFGLTPPDPKKKVMFLGGPIKLRAQKGEATYSIQSSGPEQRVTGSSGIEEQRPLLRKDGEFFDDETKQYVSLERIVGDFLEAAHEVIKEFEHQLEGSD